MEMSTGYDAAMSALDEDFARQEQLLDPEYQNNLYMIEQALQEAGALAKPNGVHPDTYDEQLLKLIDAVTLE